MKKLMFALLVVLLLVVLAVPGFALAPEGSVALAGDDDDDGDEDDVVYSNDFEGPVGPEWSNTSTDTTPIGARGFLGQFGNQTVMLTLSGLTEDDDDADDDSSITVSFELFIIHSWDGHANGPGPDVWDLTVSGGPTLLNTTFATHAPRLQAYPAPYPGNTGPPHNAPHTGAAEINSLGFPDFFGTGDVYDLCFTFPHSASSLVLDFSASGLQSLGDESWGLDNVTVTVSDDDDGCGVDDDDDDADGDDDD